MIPIRLTVTAAALGAVAFFTATLILDGGPPPAADVDATTAAKDRAAFVARVAAGLEDEPHARGRAPAAEARAVAAQPPAATEAGLDIAAATRAVLASAGPMAARAAPAPAAASAGPGHAAPRAVRRDPAPAQAAAEANAAAFGLGDARSGASRPGWIAASGPGSGAPEMRPMPRRR